LKREFIIAKTFDKNWKDLGLTDDNLREFQTFLMENPTAGNLITGTGGLRKIRWTLALSSKGKSGGIRNLYIDFMSFDTIFLVNCYGKSSQESITDKEKSMYKSLIKDIEKDFKEGLQ